MPAAGVENEVFPNYLNIECQKKKTFYIRWDRDETENCMKKCHCARYCKILLPYEKENVIFVLNFLTYCPSTIGKVHALYEISQYRAYKKNESDRTHLQNWIVILVYWKGGPVVAKIKRFSGVDVFPRCGWIWRISPSMCNFKCLFSE